MLNTAQNLPDEPTELKHLVGLLSSEVKSQALLIEKLQHQLAGMRRQRFGASSEALDQLQLTLEDEEIAKATEVVTTLDTSPDSEPEPKTQPKRKPLPDHLPRNEEVLSPGESCNNCGGNLKTLGEDVTEELEYVPGRFVVNRIVRPRMACACCESIQQAPMPSRPIERGRPGPGLLAHVLFLNMPIIFRSIGKARFLSARAWTCRARRWRIGSDNQRRFWNRLQMPSGTTSLMVNRSLPMTPR